MFPHQLGSKPQMFSWIIVQKAACGKHLKMCSTHIPHVIHFLKNEDYKISKRMSFYKYITDIIIAYIIVTPSIITIYKYYLSKLVSRAYEKLIFSENQNCELPFCREEKMSMVQFMWPDAADPEKHQEAVNCCCCAAHITATQQGTASPTGLYKQLSLHRVISFPLTVHIRVHASF